MNTLLKNIKLLLRIEGIEEDNLLKALIEQCVGSLESECGIEIDMDDLDSWSRGLQTLIVDLVIFRYNTLGKEGLASEGIAELSYSYNSDLPEHFKRRINRFRKVVFH